MDAVEDGEGSEEGHHAEWDEHFEDDHEEEAGGPFTREDDHARAIPTSPTPGDRRHHAWGQVRSHLSEIPSAVSAFHQGHQEPLTEVRVMHPPEKTSRPLPFESNSGPSVSNPLKGRERSVSFASAVSVSPSSQGGPSRDDGGLFDDNNNDTFAGFGDVIEK